jgi:hypothetical protein
MDNCFVSQQEGALTKEEVSTIGASVNAMMIAL